MKGIVRLNRDWSATTCGGAKTFELFAPRGASNLEACFLHSIGQRAAIHRIQILYQHRFPLFPSRISTHRCCEDRFVNGRDKQQRKIIMSNLLNSYLNSTSPFVYSNISSPLTSHSRKSHCYYLRWPHPLWQTGLQRYYRQRDPR